MALFHIHLVSDSTGETVNSVFRSVIAQFDGVEVEEHSWTLVRTKGHVDKVVDGIRKKPGFVLYTISDKAIRKYLKENCDKLGVQNMSVLSKAIAALSAYFGKDIKETKPGKKYQLDDEYFSRVEAINYAINHDDGQLFNDLEDADIVLVGVSRTSKSPTSMYLAYRGYRTANVPYVPGVILPDNVEKLKNPLVVGLTINSEVLAQIRRNRMLSLKENENNEYTDIEKIEEELLEARKYFTKHKWPVIDVTRRSVEETAATIIQYYQRMRGEEV